MTDHLEIGTQSRGKLPQKDKVAAGYVRNLLTDFTPKAAANLAKMIYEGYGRLLARPDYTYLLR